MSSARPRVLVCGVAPGNGGGTAWATQLLLESPLAGTYQLRHLATWDARRWLGPLRLASAHHILERRLDSGEVDLVHVQLGHGNSLRRGVNILRRCHARGVPTVAQLRGSRVLDELAGPGRRQDVLAVLSRCQLILALSRRAVRSVEAQLPPGSVQLVPNMVRRPPHPAPWPEAESLHVLFLGSLTQRKGILELLDAVASARGLCHLTIAGDGPLEGELRGRLRHAALRRRVRLLGRVPHDAVPGLLASSHVLALPTHAEQMPNVVLEAMASARAVITTTVDGCPDLIRDGVEGWLTPPGDRGALVRALEQAMADQPETRRRGLAAHERAEAFDLATGSARLDAAWRHALGRAS